MDGKIIVGAVRDCVLGCVMSGDATVSDKDDAGTKLAEVSDGDDAGIKLAVVCDVDSLITVSLPGVPGVVIDSFVTKETGDSKFVSEETGEIFTGRLVSGEINRDAVGDSSATAVCVHGRIGYPILS